MQLDLAPMPKSTVTRLFVGGIVTTVVGTGVLLGTIWGAFASDTIVLGGPNGPVQLTGGSTAWMLIAIGLVAILVILGGFAATVLSWFGALLNTFALEDRTWFLLILVLGLFSFGFIAMLAYVVAGPDSTRQARARSEMATSGPG
jgi:hypothetical protein